MVAKAKVSKLNKEEKVEDSTEEAKKAFSALMDAYKRLDAAAKEVVDERSQDPGTFSLASGETGVTATLAIRPLDRS